MSTPAGWYPQPDGQQRYWDGYKYTATWSGETGAVPDPASEGGGTPPDGSSRQSASVPVGPSTNHQTKGFFASLFDFGFTSFITLQLLSIIYGLLVGLVALASVLALIAIIDQGGSYMVLRVVGIPIVALIYLVLARVSMEMIALFFRIGQNTNLMVASAGNTGLSRSVDLTRV